MDSSSLVLGLRVVLSLAVVLGLLWYLGRRLSSTGAARRRRASTIAVVGRQSLGGKASVAMVDVAGRRLLLGVAEHGVTLLTELEAEPEPEPRRAEARDELDTDALERLIADVPADLSTLDAAPAASPQPSTTPAARMPAVPTQRNPLEGSILDVTVWRRAVVAVQERTLRR